MATITGTNGDDTIYGSVGDDTIDAGAGNDTIFAGAGNDTIYAGTGVDTIDGGTGNDTLIIDNSTDTISFSYNTDISYTTTSNGTITGGSNNGTTFKNIESINFISGTGRARINVSATTGNNNINVSAATSGFIDPIYVGSGAGNDTIVGSLIGGRNSTYSGGDGNDSITGGNGDDSIYGGAGNDILNGGAGNDFLDPGTGADSIDGGAGDDKLTIDSSTETVDTNINYTTVTNGTITGGSHNGTTFQNIEYFYIATGFGNDTINISAGAGSSINGFRATVNAGAGNDVISGGIWNDYLDAGSGDDILFGGAGNDTLIGGAGSDTFVFSGNSLLTLLNTIGVDTIADFSVGTDKVQLSKSYFTALTTTAGNPLAAADFSTVTTDAAAATANSGIVYNSTNGKLFYNLDGSAAGFGTNGGQFAQINAGLGLTANDFTVSVM